MARSQQTTAKKDKEKKKQIKRRDKAQRKEDRKANSDKGKGLEEMLAYVDENGRLSSSAPDPAKKKAIVVSDIRIGVPKREEVEQTGVREGTVTFFNDSKGYGFIRDIQTQESVFVHANALEYPIKENDKVIFEIQQGPKGLMAVNVKKN